MAKNKNYARKTMFRLERAGAEDLETIIAIQRASFKQSMTNTKMNMIPI